MNLIRLSRFALRSVAVVVLFSMSLATSPVLAARDRIPPTTPTNLHVTAKDSFSVSLAWNPSNDNSGQFSYVIVASNGQRATVPQSATSFTFTAGLEPRYAYSFYIYAVDAAGNRSRYSNRVTATLPADTIPPSAPVVSATDVGPTHVTLEWTPSVENGPFVWYQVYQDGNLLFSVEGANTTTATVSNLTPSTTYTFSVRARDNGINYSPLSDPISVTTTASDSTDTTPPTLPGNLTDNGMLFEDGELWIFWDQSTDNVTPQQFIRYDIYNNGRLDGSTVGNGRFIFYLTVGIVNEVEVFAVDASGNRSAPAALTYDLR